MWEARIALDKLDAFQTWVTEEAWPHLLAADGFHGGEVYRSMDGVDRPQAVVVSRWDSITAMLAASEWFDLGAERFLEKPAQAWEFVPVVT
jgi:hypothetical protein